MENLLKRLEYKIFKKYEKKNIKVGNLKNKDIKND